MRESVKISLQSTLIATLIGTGVGIWALELGVGKALWPDHPQLMAFIMTLIAGVVAKAASDNWLRRSGANR